MVRPPINFMNWISDNRHLLKPPVGNKVVWEDSQTIIMVVGGPNSRVDFHVNQTEEFFYQLEGNMVLKIIEDDKIKDIPIKAGEIFLLPPDVPHSPHREAGSVGLVIETKKPENIDDGFEFYCPQCSNKLYSEYFHLKNIVTELPPVFDRFYQPENSTCKKCGHQVTRN